MYALPIPSAELQAQSQQLANLIQQKIKQAGGWISFATFMQMALYTPSLGYYSGGAKKFGLGGDFVTAPEISPLFAQTLAQQVLQILTESQGYILELGAGTGVLAADLLLELEILNSLPNQYFILEVSAYLRQIQRENLHKKLSAQLFNKIVWLDKLPKNFTGLVLGNEVLDAIPAHILHKTEDGWCERGVSFDNKTSDGEFIWRDAPLSQLNLAENLPNDLPQGYMTEVCPAASGLVASLSEMLEKGAILLIDYGFNAAEYYHPQRSEGTLMCHYQHFSHSNPLINIGLQDITAHVNFTAIAETGVGSGLSLAGYCNQASFLMSCGILDILAKVSPHESTIYMPMVAATQKLLSPAEMGELFKVTAFTKDIHSDLLGFKTSNKAHTL